MSCNLFSLYIVLSVDNPIAICSRKVPIIRFNFLVIQDVEREGLDQEILVGSVSDPGHGPLIEVPFEVVSYFGIRTSPSGGTSSECYCNTCKASDLLLKIYSSEVGFRFLCSCY